MSEVTATMIEERNRKYLDGLQGNIGKYLSFLSTMARLFRKRQKVCPSADTRLFVMFRRNRQQSTGRLSRYFCAAIPAKPCRRLSQHLAR